MELEYIDDGQIYRLIHEIHAGLIGAALLVRKWKQDGLTDVEYERLLTVLEGSQLGNHQQDDSVYRLPDTLDLLAGALEEGYGIDTTTDPDDETDEETEDDADDSEESEAEIEA